MIREPESVESRTDDDEFQCPSENLKPQLLTLAKLNDLVRDLGLTKKKTELVCSRLKEKHLLLAGTSAFQSSKRIWFTAMILGV